MLNLSPQPILQIVTGLAILGWYFWGLHFRFTIARKYDIGFLDVNLPQWHEQMFWPLLILLLIGLIWGFL